MQPFAYSRAGQADQAVSAGADANTFFLAGGTELLNWMRLGIVSPSAIVDITRIAGLNRVEQMANGGVRIGALVTLNDAAQLPIIVRDFPVLSESILKAASAQLRNLATVGGNLMQRTRCPYFRAEETLPCNKRVAGSGCSARHGINDKHAIFGWTDDCVAVQPSDPAVALAVLDAVVVTESRDGGRRIPAREFHTLPEEGADPARHNVLRQGELITAIEIDTPARRSAYLKIRDRESYAYATVSAAAAVECDGDRILNARIALGSVAHRPWRLEAAETRLTGVRINSADIRAAIDAAFVTARPLSHNAHKIPLARNAAWRVLQIATGRVS
jgi:xanthine dehydrogenase YagS FAD-binding subunit